MHFSPSTKGFYTEAMHGNNIPQDVVEITAERHTALLAGQSAGHVITADKNGRPVLEARKVPDDAHYAKHARKQRGSLLLECDWVVLPDVPMDEKTRADWIEYRQALRDVPAQPTFPQKIDWPTPPKSAKKEK